MKSDHPNIASERKVSYKGNEFFLTALTRKLLDNEFDVSPGPYWYYNGESISDIYNKTYPMP